MFFLQKKNLPEWKCAVIDKFMDSITSYGRQLVQNQPGESQPEQELPSEDEDEEEGEPVEELVR